MKRILILFVFVGFIFSLLTANQYSIIFEKPKIKSEYYYHILQKERPKKIMSLKDYCPDSYFWGMHTSFFNYKTDKLYLFFSYKLGVSYAKNKQLNYYQYFYGATLKGNIKDRLLFFSDWWKIQFSKPVSEIEPPMQDSWNEEKSIDNSNTILEYKTNIADIFLGRSKFQIGNGISGSVILSDVSDEYGFFALKFKMKKFGFSLLHSSLIPDSLNSDFVQNPTDFWNKKYEDKFLALHKIDYYNENLHIFLGESVVYGSRSLDVNYMLPFGFWRAIEHNLGDRDNMFMFFGWDWEFFNKNIIYFNFNLDDLTKAKIFTDFWGNKYAAQLGYQKKVNDKIRFTTELVAVRPWTYTHKKVVNVFSNNKKPLGYPYGSNLLAANVEISYRIFNNLKSVCKYSYVKQGSVGNSFDMNYLQVGDQTTAKAKWLDGDINNINKVYLALDYTFLFANSLHLAMEFQKDNNEKNSRISLQYKIQF